MPLRLSCTVVRALALVPPIAAALLGVVPLASGRAPWGHDSHMHLERIAALYAALRGGNLYPRWFDGFFFGYGYPVLHFYAPLTYYLGALFRLLGADVPLAFDLIVLTARVVGALGGFLLGRRLLGGRWAGLVVGTGFALLPYQLTEIYVRAALAEQVALNLLPWALWGVERLWRGAGHPARGAALAGGLVALLVLVHQTTALVTTGTVAAFAAARALPRPGRAALWLGAAAGLAAA